MRRSILIQRAMVNSAALEKRHAVSISSVREIDSNKEIDFVSEQSVVR